MRRASLSLALLAVCAVLAAAPTLAQDAASKPYLSLQQLRARYEDTNGRYLNVDGVEVYYKDEGAGPAILMVHGSQSTLRTWDGVAARLKRHYRVLRYDVPPQGLSGPVSAEAAARLAPVDIAERLLALRGVHDVAVVGVSSGGTLGVQLAAKRPDLVNRLIISNAPANTVTTNHLVLSPALQAAMDEEKVTGFRSIGFWNAFLDYFAGDPARISRRTREQYYDMNRRAPEENLLSLVAQVRDQQKTRAAMAAVKAPTLLIWGARDQLLPTAAADVLAGYLTNAQVSKVILPDVGHYPPLEAPDRFAQLVAAYLEAAVPSDAIIPE